MMSSREAVSRILDQSNTSVHQAGFTMAFMADADLLNILDVHGEKIMIFIRLDVFNVPTIVRLVMSGPRTISAVKQLQLASADLVNTMIGIVRLVFRFLDLVGVTNTGVISLDDVSSARRFAGETNITIMALVPAVRITKLADPVSTGIKISIAAKIFLVPAALTDSGGILKDAAA
jgi:hypothetical protein